MIDLQELNESIALYKGDKSPTIDTIIKLAACFYVREVMFERKTQQQPEVDYAPILKAISMANDPPTPAEEIVDFPSKSEFAREIDGKRAADIWPVMDEIMSIFATYHPDLYNRAMQILKTK